MGVIETLLFLLLLFVIFSLFTAVAVFFWIGCTIPNLYVWFQMRFIKREKGKENVMCQ
ncbi:Uncharacterised protein [Mycobacterium tuberculosis]|nr:Uncharacterised protein [Mycobacterium tuberculosis]